MIVSASNNPQLLSRWNTALSAEYKKDQVENFDQLVSSIEKNQPDMILVHMSLPGLEGLTGLEKINNYSSDIKIFALTDKPSELEGIKLLKLGALGYANSFISVNYLKEAIKVIKMGEVWIGKRLMQWLVTQCTDMTDVNEVTDISNYINLGYRPEFSEKIFKIIFGYLVG